MSFIVDPQARFRRSGAETAFKREPALREWSAEIPQFDHPDEGRPFVALPPVQASYAVGEDLDLFPSIAGTGPSAKLIRLPVVPDERGKLSFIEGGRHVPFDIARVYFLYDVPAAAVRGGHAHKELKQFIIAASGSFDVRLDTGRFRRVVQLNRPNIGLLISSMIWREIDNFSSGGICLVLASLPYDEADYYREYETFLKSCPKSPPPERRRGRSDGANAATTALGSD